MSLGNWGVFQLLKRVTFRRILAFDGSIKLGCFSGAFSIFCSFCFGSNMRHNTDWVLAMRRPEVTEHIAANEIGMFFINALYILSINVVFKYSYGFT